MHHVRGAGGAAHPAAQAGCGEAGESNAREAGCAPGRDGPGRLPSAFGASGKPRKPPAMVTSWPSSVSARAWLTATRTGPPYSPVGLTRVTIERMRTLRPRPSRRSAARAAAVGGRAGRCRHDGVIGDVAHDEGSGAHDGVAADGAPAQHGRAGGDPRAVADDDGCVVEFEGRGAPVVTACAQQHVLRDADVVPEGDRLQVQDPGALADPAVVAHRELPRPVDLHPVPDENARADGGAERAEDGVPQRHRAPPADDDQPGDEEPHRLDRRVATFVVSRSGETRESARRKLRHFLSVRRRG